MLADGILNEAIGAAAHMNAEVAFQAFKSQLVSLHTSISLVTVWTL